NLPLEEARALLPENMSLLAKIFPVLESVAQLSLSEQAAPPMQSALEMRAYAFTALRELLSRLGRSHPLVLVIDGLQWADADSFTLPAARLRLPAPPPLLLLSTVRTQTTSQEVVRAGLSGLPGDIRNLYIEKLSAEYARELALRLLANLDEGSAVHTAESIAL